MRGEPFTNGNALRSSVFRSSREDNTAPERSGMMPPSPRSMPSSSNMPGCSCPRSPYLSNRTLYLTPCSFCCVPLCNKSSIEKTHKKSLALEPGFNHECIKSLFCCRDAFQISDEVCTPIVFFDAGKIHTGAFDEFFWFFQIFIQFGFFPHQTFFGGLFHGF